MKRNNPIYNGTGTKTTIDGKELSSEEIEKLEKEGFGRTPNFDFGGGGGKAITQAELDAEKEVEAKRIAEETNKNAGKTPEQVEAEKVEAARIKAEQDDKIDKTKILIDEVEYKLDDKGNAVDKDGKVFKTKEEIDALQAENDIPPLTLEVLQKIGITPVGEDGKPKVYGETIEDVIQMTKDVAIEIAAQEQKKFFDKVPQVTELAKHLLAGGTEQDFYKAKLASWKNITLEGASEEKKMSVIIDDLTSKGMDKETAEMTAKLYKDSNKLDEMSDKAVKGQVAAEEKRTKEKDKADQEAYEKDVKDNIEFWENKVQPVIKGGKLKDITIPDVDREAFFKHIAISVTEEGHTQYDIDFSKLTLEEKLQLQYLAFKKFNLDKLIQNKAATLNVQSLRSRVKQAGKTENHNGASQEGKRTANANIDLKNLV